MTGRQLTCLLALEGLLYAALCILIVALPTILFTCFIMPDVVNNYSWASAYTFSLVPLWIILPVILFFSLTVPLLCLHFLRKGSIRQRMGISE